MRSRLTLLTTAGALSLGLAASGAYAAAGMPAGEAPGAKSDITIVDNPTTPTQSGIENSAGSKGATNMNTPGSPATGAGSMQSGASGMNTTPRGDGVKESEAGQGAVKQADPGVPTSGAGSMQGGGGMHAAPRGDGVSQSEQGQGEVNKNSD